MDSLDKVREEMRTEEQAQANEKNVYLNFAKIFLMAAFFINLQCSSIGTAFFNGLMGTDFPPKPYAGAFSLALSAACALIHIAQNSGRGN